MLTVVERELELTLVLAPGESIPVPARLVYRTDDPYAVHLVFHTGTQDAVRWTFCRELLLGGIFEPCGRGDVRIWPSVAEDSRTVCLALRAPGGSALLEAPLPPIAAWLESTMRVVPPGTESERLDIDEPLERLLEAASRSEPRSPGPGSAANPGPITGDQPAGGG